MGPGKARTVFKSYLNEQFPSVASNVWDVQTSDHPTDREIIAAARTWFHAQDRMHPVALQPGLVSCSAIQSPI